MNTSFVELKMYNDLMRFQIILFLFLAHHNPHLSALALITNPGISRLRETAQSAQFGVFRAFREIPRTSRAIQ